MNEEPVWYTDDVTLHPVAMIWRSSLKQGLMAPLICAYFLIRKAVGWRFPAFYATARPERLHLIAAEEIPAEVREQMTPALAACQVAGFTPCFFWKPEFLGGRSAYSTYLLSHDGLSYATIVWFRISFRSFLRESVTFGCHSVASDGRTLDTAAAPAWVFHPKLIPEDRDFQRLPGEALPAETITAHDARIRNRKDLRAFDCDSLRAHILADARDNIDWRVAHRFLVPLTRREVERLQNS